MPHSAVAVAVARAAAARAGAARAGAVLGCVAAATLGLSGCGTAGAADRSSGAHTSASSSPTSSSPTSAAAPTEAAITATSLSGQHFGGSTLLGRRIAPGTTVRLGFQAGTLTADAGCNTLTSTYAVTSGRLVVRSLRFTGMPCPSALGAQDTWLASLLTSSPALSEHGRVLTVGSSTRGLRLTQQSGQELPGTRWAVVRTTRGGAWTPVPAGAHASLVFDGDGQHGSVATGCNSGGFAMSRLTSQGPGRGTVVLRPTVMTQLACAAERMLLQREVLGALSGPVHYALGHDGTVARLTLTAASGGNGLVLRALPATGHVMAPAGPGSGAVSAG